MWWPRPELNQRHTDFQSAALPTELLGRAGASGIKKTNARKRSADYKGKFTRPPRIPCGDCCRPRYNTLPAAGRLNAAAPASQIHIEATLSRLPSTRRS